MRIRLAFLSMIPAVFTCTGAWAEAINEEVVRYPSLLSLGEVTQAAGVSYGYTGHKTAGRFTYSQNLSESYSIGTRAAVLDPDVLLLQLRGGVSFQQQLANSGSKLLNWDYDIVGSAFQMSYHPILLSANRNSSTVSSGYLPSYTTERTNYRVSASLLNNLFPVRMFFLHATSQTTGLATDISGTSDAGGIGVHHDLGGVSSTDATLSFNTSTSGVTESRSYSAFLLNRSDLDAAKRYHLITKTSLVDSVTSEIPQRQVDLSLSFSGSPGSALSCSLSGQTSYNASESFEGERQVIKTRSLAGSLGHRLYQSVVTTLSGSIGESAALGGSESNYDLNARLAYQKKLPADSLLTLNANFGHTVTNQDYQDTVLSARDEIHQVVQQGDKIAPNLTGRLLRVVTLKSLDPEIIYTPGIDYQIDPSSNKIEIIVNGSIAPGTTIYISYEVGVNKNIDFATNSQSYLAAVTLFGGRYTVTGDYANSTQKEISGEADTAALSDFSAINLRGTAHYTDTDLGVEYGTLSGSQENLSRFAAFWTHTTHIFSNDTLRLNFRDVYTMYEASGTSNAYDINVATMGTSYNRNIFGGIRLQLSANLSDSRRSGGAASDMAMLRMGLDGNYNQVIISLNAQTSYRMVSGPDTRDDSLQFQIVRYF